MHVLVGDEVLFCYQRSWLVVNALSHMLHAMVMGWFDMVWLVLLVCLQAWATLGF